MKIRVAGFGKEDAREVVGEAKHCAFLGDGGVVDFSSPRGGRHEHTSDRKEQDECVNLLPDAVGRFRPELPLADVVTLQKLVELLRLPTQVIEFADLLTAELRPPQSREKEGLRAVRCDEANRANAQRLPFGWSVFGRLKSDERIIAMALAKLIDRSEGVRTRNAHEEVEALLRQSLKNLVRWVSAIEDHHVSGRYVSGHDTPTIWPLAAVRG